MGVWEVCEGYLSFRSKSGEHTGRLARLDRLRRVAAGDMLPLSSELICNFSALHRMLDDLNEQQKEAVTYSKGPLLIFAGAGSGKTRVITYRIAWLIETGIVPSEGILAMTFTKKAAGEMKERVGHLLSGKHIQPLPYIGTFHSFGASILRKEGSLLGIPPGFSIYDPDDGIHLVKQIMDDAKIDKKQFNPSIVLSNISSAKNEMISPDEYKKFVTGVFEEITAQVYSEYEKGLREQGAVDFDDLQILPLQLLREDARMRQRYHEKYPYILVDEYQDTNVVQYNLVKTLTGKDKNVCVVGDDDQGIYSWRGATVKNILSFERDFPGAKVVRLEKNYRSTANILQVAQSVISNNEQRAKKDLWTDAPHGEMISVYEAKHDHDEASYIVDRVKEHVRFGGKLNNVAVLYRINAQSRALEEEFIRAAIPYRLVGGVRFYERREIKDMLAYLRFFANPQDELSFLRVINVPPRKIGKISINTLRKTARDETRGLLNAGQLMLVLWGMTKEIDDWERYLPGSGLDEKLIDILSESDAIEKLRATYKTMISLFGHLYESSRTVNARQLIDEIIEATDYENWIDDGTEQVESRLENLFELKNVAEKHNALGPRDSLLAFLEDVALVEQEQESADMLDASGEKDGVTLMTLHAAKGLEFDIVFIVGMEEGLFPHMRSFTSPQELEEERRLCYVGITRAKKKLYLTFADNRKTYGGLSDRIPSRFISEVPTELMEFRAWG